MSNKQQYQSIEHKLPVFFRTWWLDIVCDGDWDVAIMKDGEEIIAVWPYQIEKKYGFKITRNPSLTPYLGPLWIADQTKALDWISDLWEQLPKADFRQWSCVPEHQEFDFFRNQNIDITDKVTYFLDLRQSKEALWAQMHSTRRNGIRKGEQELQLVKTDLPIEEFMQWHRSSFENKDKKYPYSKIFLENIVSAAHKQQTSVCFAARDAEGKNIALLWLAYDHQKMYYLLSATAPDTHRGAMALLTWNAIQEAQQMGLEAFDFEGSMDPGIARFFQRFGGTKMCYRNCEITYSPLWKLKNKLLS